MRIDIGYILGHVSELILFIYYANTSFYPKNNVRSNLISLGGYMILFAVGLIGNAALSISSFLVINIILLMSGYSIKLKGAIFYALILDVLSIIGEYMFIQLLNINSGAMGEITQQQSLAITVGGKLMYLIGIVFLKRYTNQKMTENNDSQLVLAVVPMLTIVCLTLMMNSEIAPRLFLLVCIVFLLMNIITFYINAGLDEKNRALRQLQEEYNQNKAELCEYQLLSEKYENTKIMRHDFHKQLNVLKELITEDNVRAKEYMRQIQFSQRELDYAQYTDNKILNILLEQKIKECHKHGVEVHINSLFPVMSFVSDIDVVAIFSNLIDNAMEASMKSEEKEIYIDLYTVNHAYSAVKIENSADSEPVVLNGLLRTQKGRRDIHGMGIKSINNALKKYNSELNWTYDKENKFFTAMVLIHIPMQNQPMQEEIMQDF